MARIKGVEIPDNKRIVISLTYIYGIGNNIAKQILKNVNIDENARTKTLSNEQLLIIRDEVNKYLTEGELRREVATNIKRKMEINCYQGVYHKRGLPVRGQRTKTNARTRKGKPKTVANKKK